MTKFNNRFEVLSDKKRLREMAHFVNSKRKKTHSSAVVAPFTESDYDFCELTEPFSQVIPVTPEHQSPLVTGENDFLALEWERQQQAWGLWDDFFMHLEKIPRVVEAAIENTAEPSADSIPRSAIYAYEPRSISPVITSQLFDFVENDAGGDCLFLALENRQNMPLDEMMVLRHAVASQLPYIRPENKSLNAQNMFMLLFQTAEWAADMMYGRHEADNALYQKLQCIPGMFAGDDEINQYCRLKNVKVHVFEEGQSFRSYPSVNPGRSFDVVDCTTEKEKKLKQAMLQDTIKIFKFANHYVRVRALNRVNEHKSVSFAADVPDLAGSQTPTTPSVSFFSPPKTEVMADSSTESWDGDHWATNCIQQ